MAVKSLGAESAQVTLAELRTSGLLAFAQSAAWEIAVKRVADASAAAEEFYDREVRPVNEAHEAGSASMEQVREAEDAVAIYWDGRHDAIRALVSTKAPTLAALAQKIEVAHADSVFNCGYVDEAIGAVLADLRRLAGEA